MGGIARRKLQSVTYYDHEKAFNGYTFFAPFWEQTRAYLIDMKGRIVNYWQLPGRVGEITLILPNGNILYPLRLEIEGSPIFTGFCGCKLLEVDWDGNVVWEYVDNFQHHAIQQLENGNRMLMRIVATPFEIARTVKGGQHLTEDNGNMWSCALKEVNPKGAVIWEWFAYKHLDPEVDTICPLEYRSEWTHGNSIEELKNGDILTCFRYPSQVIIIDKITGEIKWKWGKGEVFHPHNPTMLKNGNILLFDNGVHRHDSYLDYSRCIEVNPKTNKIEWEYKGTPPTEFYSSVAGSCQRLQNGNTLVCETTKGRIFEVTQEKEIVWEYIIPFYAPGISGWGDFNLGHNNYAHRAYRYGPDFSGFKDKDMDPDRFKAINDIYVQQAFKMEEK